MSIPCHVIGGVQSIFPGVMHSRQVLSATAQVPATGMFPEMHSSGASFTPISKAVNMSISGVSWGSWSGFLIAGAGRVLDITPSPYHSTPSHVHAWTLQRYRLLLSMVSPAFLVYSLFLSADLLVECLKMSFPIIDTIQS